MLVQNMKESSLLLPAHKASLSAFIIVDIIVDVHWLCMYVGSSNRFDQIQNYT
jgi:hypothetical protein